MLYLFEFLSFAFPKAGAEIAGIPLQIANVFFLFAALLVLKNAGGFFNRHKHFIFVYACFAAAVMIPTLINYEGLQPVVKSVLLVGSPYAVIIGYSMDFEKFMKVLSVALLIVGLFTLLQFLFGLEATKINGLTISYGTSYDEKPIGVWEGGQKNLVKIPSTYQNGSLLAAFLLMSTAAMCEWEPSKKGAIVLKWAALLTGIVSLLLSGSRSNVFVIVLLIPIIFAVVYRRLSPRKRYVLLMCLPVVLLLAVLYILIFNSNFLDFIWNSYIGKTLGDTTGMGRTVQWQNLFSQIYAFDFGELMRFVFVGIPWKDAVWTEGYTYLMTYYGLISLFLFWTLLVSPVVSLFKKYKLLCLGTIALLIVFVFDTSFLFPPTLFNYFLIVGAFLSKEKDKKTAEEVSYARL